MNRKKLLLISYLNGKELQSAQALKTHWSLCLSLGRIRGTTLSSKMAAAQSLSSIMQHTNLIWHNLKSTKFKKAESKRFKSTGLRLATCRLGGSHFMISKANKCSGRQSFGTSQSLAIKRLNWPKMRGSVVSLVVLKPFIKDAMATGVI